MRNLEITVIGLVQGVGFRPFVAEAARELSVSGTVWNAGGVVKIRAASCDDEALEQLLRRLSSCSLPGARVDEILVEDNLSTSADWSWLPVRTREKTPRVALMKATPAARAGTLAQTVSHQDLGRTQQESFIIIESEPREDEVRFLPADIATCEQCERELLEPGNRRYRYPFISCVSCGPRFTVMREVPYDRERTSMKKFPMCTECGNEYVREGDIRRHAQTIACAECGPKVRLYEARSGCPKLDNGDTNGDGINSDSVRGAVGRDGIGSLLADEAVFAAIRLIKSGCIVAVKDIGGYHFCFDPDNEQAAVRLRRFKNRERKPFAVMFPDIRSVRKYCRVSDAEEKLLLSPARPIVLADKKKGMDFAPSVCGNSRQIGAMLPCNPIQILLTRECGPLVMTSGNRGGEPIITDDETMLGFLGTSLQKTETGQLFEDDSVSMGLCVPDAVLTHDREILNGLDDSIFQVTEVCGQNYIQVLRRARGIVPEPVGLPIEFDKDVFAAGGDLKAVFALGRKNYAYLSGHFGDAEDSRAFYARGKGIESMERLLGIKPDIYICDKHPGYHTASLPDPVRVQHHYAHILSVAAEHGLTGRFLGVAFDGTGYGDDGTIWGSEFLLCTDDGYKRVGHFSAISMTGGDGSARDARLSLYAYLYAAECRGLLNSAEIDCFFKHRENISHMDKTSDINLPTYDVVSEGCDRNEYQTVASAIRSGINTVVSSSMGRLFDAVCALLGICYTNTYEGECACMLQAAAEEWLEAHNGSVNNTSEFNDDFTPGEVMTYMPEMWFPVKPGYEIDSVFYFAQMVRHFNYGEDIGKLSLDFHASVADATTELCAQIACTQVALSGGTMCNRLLLKRLMMSLKKRGMTVYINEKVPPGDGGISLGQLMFSGINDMEQLKSKI
ncbi:MAG: carbamoyltransferase HypF [Eubacterium sp.]|nr:carbamoyltransferase HypF [Eubacterium sp.]